MSKEEKEVSNAYANSALIGNWQEERLQQA